jgi:hypothetical protein
MRATQTNTVGDSGALRTLDKSIIDSRPSTSNPIPAPSIKPDNLFRTGLTFKQIKPGEKPKNKELERVLRHFTVGRNKYNNAAISENPNDPKQDSLVIAIDGKTAHRKLFRKDFTYKLFGCLSRFFGGRDQAWGHKLYQKIYSPEYNKELTHRGESLEQFEKALNDNDYHLIALFKKDKKGKWRKDPNLALVTDSYYRVLEKDTSNNLGDRDTLMREFKHSITVDKVLADHKIDNYNLRLAELIEGLFTAQESKIDMLFLRNKLPREYLSQALDIVELNNWQHPAQKLDHSWELLSDNASIIRPSIHKAKPADPHIADLQAATVTSTGADKLVKDTTHKEKIETAIKHNQGILEQFNSFVKRQEAA